MITKITAAYTRRYTDTGQVIRCVEWIDHNGKAGRTVGSTDYNAHMSALINRAIRDGVKYELQTW